MIDYILEEFNRPRASHYSWRLYVGGFVIKILCGRLY